MSIRFSNLFSFLQSSGFYREIKAAGITMCMLLFAAIISSNSEVIIASLSSETGALVMVFTMAAIVIGIAVNTWFHVKQIKK